MKRPLVVFVLAPLLILILAVAGYFTWGAVMKRRFHARLDELSAQGTPTRLEDLVEPVVPAEDNGADLLAEAEAMREAVEEAAMEDLGWLNLWEVESWEEEADRPDEEDLALAAEMMKRLAPYDAKLDDVLTRPALKLEREGPMDGPPFVQIQNAVQYAELRARLDPTRREAALDRSFGLLARWRAHTGVELITRPALWREACDSLREMLQAKSPPTEPLLARWGPVLARSEADLPEAVRLASLESLAQKVWVVCEWGAGRDPFAKMRAMFAELSALLADVEPNEDTREAARGIHAITTFGLRIPWQSRWWGRPFLWRDGLTMLEGYDESPFADRADVASLRTWLDSERKRADWQETFDRVNSVRLALQQVAVTRLARVALAIHDHQREHGTPPDSIDALAERLGGAVPLDPLTGQPFRYQVGGGRIFLQVDPQGDLLPFVLAPNEEQHREVSYEELEDGLLHWSLPVR